MEVTFRPLGPDDVELVKWALYEAVSWSPERELPPHDVLIDHPQLARYHRDWGRAGDLGVVAEMDDVVVGVSFCRLFTDEDHGYGYVDEHTLELGVAVVEAQRGNGIGGQLLERLADRAREMAFARLSLSVDADNPARRLYQRLGYEELSVVDGDVRMALEL
jgi:ribosomal protein S18 acetylase RimI-like enzyme